MSSDIYLNGITYPSSRKVAFPGKDGKEVVFDLPEDADAGLNAYSERPVQNKVIHAAIEDVRQRQTSPYNFKGSVAAAANLPSSGNTVNDTYYVEALKHRMTWTGSAWQQSSMDEGEYEDELAVLKNSMSDNVTDLLWYGTPPATREQGGVTATMVDKNKFTFSGTITGSGFFAWYQSLTVCPDWLVPGESYLITIAGASENTKVYFEVLGIGPDNAQVKLTGFLFGDGEYRFTVPADFSGGVYIRAGWLVADQGTAVDETIEFHMYNAGTTGRQAADLARQFSQYGMRLEADTGRYTSCDDVPSGTILPVSSVGGVLSIGDFPFGSAGTLVSLGALNLPNQFALSYTEPFRILHRQKYVNGTWSDWVAFSDVRTAYSYDSCDDIAETCVLFVPSYQGVLRIPDAPFVGWLQTYYLSGTGVFQLAYPWDSASGIKYRAKNSAGWTAWKSVGSGTTTVTVTQEVSRDSYQNTYNIETAPRITTDSNGWLQAVDVSTADETGKTDMTGPIMAMLASTGYCHLGPGIFYVSGNIDMPADSVLEGCGRKTVIRLLQSTASGYIVRMHTRSTLKNLCLSGGYAALDISSGSIGGRRGINYIGNRDGKDSGVTPSTCTLCMVEGCWFENLDSGIYGYNAGGGLQEGLEVCNCYFTRCKAGINIDYWTEYCKFTNCVMFFCHYACIDNGGNNVFTACTFHGIVGYMIDNSGGNKPNNAHGSVVNCTFNHIDNINHPETLGGGYGIKILGTPSGCIISDCHIGYARVYVEDSKGVKLSGCHFIGNTRMSIPSLETSGDGTVFLDGCLFDALPITDISSPVIFDGCYTFAGAAVTG